MSSIEKFMQHGRMWAGEVSLPGQIHVRVSEYARESLERRVRNDGRGIEIAIYEGVGCAQ